MLNEKISPDGSFIYLNSLFINRLTFALLEDTGWYQPNYEYAQEITWGRGMGCDFAKKSCMELMENSDHHFCKDLMSSGSSKTTCTFDSGNAYQHPF